MSGEGEICLAWERQIESRLSVHASKQDDTHTWCECVSSCTCRAKVHIHNTETKCTSPIHIFGIPATLIIMQRARIAHKLPAHRAVAGLQSMQALRCILVALQPAPPPPLHLPAHTPASTFLALPHALHFRNLLQFVSPFPAPTPAKCSANALEQPCLASFLAPSPSLHRRIIGRSDPGSGGKRGFRIHELGFEVQGSEFRELW